MKIESADNFFDDINFPSIVSTVKGIMTSDGSMAALLDFERVLDESDLYAYKNWLLGELVAGPDIGRYSVKCTFMWPYKLMPDPKAIKRLTRIGCNLKWAKSTLEVPVEVKDYEDFVPGTRYPKGIKKKVWYVQIEIPKHLMDELREGSIDLEDQSIDLEEIDQAYEDDLDKENLQQDEQLDGQQGFDQQMGGPAAGAAPMAPTQPAM